MGQTTFWDMFDVFPPKSALIVEFQAYGPQKPHKVQLDKKSSIKAVFIPNYILKWRSTETAQTL